MTEATCGALGAVGEHNTLVQFIPVGLGEEEMEGRLDAMAPDQVA
ncbi:hypothetical protein AB0J63_44705 [Streptosporangium canum]